MTLSSVRLLQLSVFLYQTRDAAFFVLRGMVGAEPIY